MGFLLGERGGIIELVNGDDPAEGCAIWTFEGSRLPTANVWWMWR